MPRSFCPMRRKNLKQLKIIAGSGDRPLFPPPTVSFLVITSPTLERRSPPNRSDKLGQSPVHELANRLERWPMLDF